MTATQRSELTWIWQDRRMFGAISPSRARRFCSSSSGSRDIASQDLHPAGRAPGVSTTSMHDVNSRVLDGQHQLLAGFDLERFFTVNGYGWHDPEAPLGVSRSPGQRSGSEADEKDEARRFHGLASRIRQVGTVTMLKVCMAWLRLQGSNR